MSAHLSRWSVASVFLRSFFIQGSWNYRTMIGSGFAFAMLPALRKIFKGNPDGFSASLSRHVEHFNAHPYLTGVALGAAVRLESDGADPLLIQRFKTAVRGPLGGVGDALVWASWLPAVSLAALALLWLGAPAWVPVLVFVLVYNVGHLALRAWGFRAGLEEGERVGGRLSTAALGMWTERVRTLATLLLGLAVGAVLSAPGGLADAGALWGALGIGAFLVGLLLGQRIWRPAAVLVVAAVALFTAWGTLS